MTMLCAAGPARKRFIVCQAIFMKLSQPAAEPPHDETGPFHLGFVSFLHRLLVKVSGPRYPDSSASQWQERKVSCQQGRMLYTHVSRMPDMRQKSSRRRYQPSSRPPMLRYGGRLRLKYRVLSRGNYFTTVSTLGATHQEHPKSDRRRDSVR